MSVSLGTFKAVFGGDEGSDRSEAQPPPLPADVASFAGRLTRAMVRTPLPSSSSVNATKGVPNIDLLALDAVPLHQPGVACAPRFWATSELVARVCATEDEAEPAIDAAAGAGANGSSEQRREQQTTYVPDIVLAPLSAAPARHLPVVVGEQPIGRASTHKAALPETSDKSDHKPVVREVAAATQTSTKATQSAAPTAVAAVAAAAAKAAAQTAQVQGGEASGPRGAGKLGAPVRATQTPALAPVTADAAALPPRSSRGENAAAAKSADQQRSEAPVPQLNSPLPEVGPRTSATSAPAAPPSAPAPRADQEAELASPHIRWKPGEARLSVQTDAGALSLHVRVLHGVADVEASGPAAKQLSKKRHDLNAQLAKEGLVLGRFAALEAHHAELLLRGAGESDVELGSCQEPDEDDGTGSAEGGDERRVSGERRRLRPSRRVHVKA